MSPGNRGFTFPESSRPSTQSSRAGESTASSMMGSAKETAQEWASSAASTAENAWDSARQQAGNLAHQAGEALDTFDGFVRRYPFASLLGAVGIGFLLGGAVQCMTRSAAPPSA